MKNKNTFILIILFCFFFINFSFSEEFEFESSEIKIIDRGKILKATGGVKILTKDGIEILANESKYNKLKNVLEVFGDVKIKDNIDNIKIEAKKIIYNKNLEQIISKGKTKSNIKSKYKIETFNLMHDRNLMELSSKENSKLEDGYGNKFNVEEFRFKINEELIMAKGLSLFDNQNNKLYLKNAVVDLKNFEIIGKDININFDNSIFGNKNNEPRLKGNAVTYNSTESTIYKGSFTSCKKNKKRCPAWSIYADEVKHKKNEKKIEYKNAWLKIYDKPIIYFPYFFHPDPTVKRQSGFLPPSFINSNVYGTSIQIPYYNVISHDKDITIAPRIFLDNNLFVQSEYRQAFNKSDLILDGSLNRENNNTKSHFFSNWNYNKENINLEINLQKVSSDNYLKKNKIVSDITDSSSLLHTYLKYDYLGDDYFFNTSIEIYEDLTKKKSDRFEYIYPNFNYIKDLNNPFSEKWNLKFSSFGFQKKYDTNVYEFSVVNDFNFSLPSRISTKGLKNNYEFLVRNINVNSEKSKNFNDEEYKLLSLFLFETTYPLIKKNDKNVKYLTPIFSARYSPNPTKNKNNLDRRLSYDNIFTLDRIGENDMVEGGQSISIGLEYSIKDLEENDYFNIGFASNFRNKKELDLPNKTSLGEKRSDIIGKLNFVPSKYFDFEYEFSLDKNLNHTNYDHLKTNLTINNFVTSFEFLEEDNFIGNESYLINKNTFNFDKNNSLSFGTSKNLDKNITDYYNLIYEYKNDCLTAAVEYNKEYYSDDDLKPEESLFLSIKIPFGKINSPSLTQ